MSTSYYHYFAFGAIVFRKIINKKNDNYQKEFLVVRNVRTLNTSDINRE